jgi:KDO2-lipid IV(A) lauroyltransferase
MWKYVLFVVALHTLGRLPLRPLYRFCACVGDLVYWLFPRLRRNVWDNMRHVLGPQASRGEVRRAARRVFRNVAKYYADLVHMPRLDLNDLYHRRMNIRGLEENLRPALAQGRGVIIMSAHMGSPELAMQALLMAGIQGMALTEPLRPARLSRLVDGLRSSQGLTFLPVGVTGVKAAMRTLRSGGVVALMGDRDIEGPKALLPLCGYETLVPTGPMELALRTGATVIPAFCYRRGWEGLEVVLEEPLELVRTGNFQEDVLVNTRRFLERFERYLRQEPSQWLVLERVWDAAMTRERRD